MAETISMKFSFFFQAEDGIRDLYVTGVQTCALPISMCAALLLAACATEMDTKDDASAFPGSINEDGKRDSRTSPEIGRASCRERVESSVGAGSSKKRLGELEGWTQRLETTSRQVGTV